jgi:sugar phosphate isomerase/epimerase
MMTTRRQFVKALSFAAAAAAFAEDHKASGLPIAFSTLGCPEWGLEKILGFANSHAFAAIELRGLQGTMDLPSHPVFARDRIETTKGLLSGSGIKIACVSSSARMGEPDPAKRSLELADARRFIDLAAFLGAPYVRVFGDGPSVEKPAAPPEELKARVADSLHQLGDYAGTNNVTVIIESHDNFTASATLDEVFERAKSPNVALLWDAHHTFVTAGEDPESTVRRLGRWIRHTHLKDSVGTGEHRTYVLTGRGTVPIQRQIEALRLIRYAGYLCFEWEKVWHPDLAEPEIAIADYAEVVRGYFARQAGH